MMEKLSRSKAPWLDEARVQPGNLDVEDGCEAYIEHRTYGMAHMTISRDGNIVEAQEAQGNVHPGLTCKMRLCRHKFRQLQS
jgi:hypothetical protein